jgi:hypothetical protein
MTPIAGPQMGSVTNHQDHVMYPVSFSTTNATVSAPKNPIPDELLEDMLFPIL